MDIHRYIIRDPVAPPVNGAFPHSSLTLGDKIDTKMVIIIGALLCVLTCALGISPIFRWVVRFSQMLSLVEEPNSDVGLGKSELRHIPVAVYGLQGADVAGTDTDCVICLGEFVGGEKVRVLPKCDHKFHVECVDVWLEAHSSCPTCRRSLADAAMMVGGGEAEREGEFQRQFGEVGDGTVTNEEIE